jgi:three-Cys-motif partner protein
MAPKTTVWPLEHHTKAKHEILRKYLAAWFPILTAGGWNRRVVFLDGFAGPGVYEGGEPGSPVVAIDTLLSHKLFRKLDHTEFLFLFVENDSERCESLDEKLTELFDAHGGRPKNVKVSIVEKEFRHAAEELIGDLKEQKKQLAPTFAFIDPFGWSGVPLDTICRLLSYDKCEVFFNLMYDAMNRFLTHEPTAHHRRELFGTDDYLAAEGMNPRQRSGFLHNLYKRQLNAEGGFRYVHSFEMVNRQRHTVYSLFYGTRSIDGLRVMKDAMWSVDPVGGLRFSDQLAGQPVLFTPRPDFAPLLNAIVQRFAGKSATVDQIEEFVLVETPYKASHYKRQILKPLQRDGRIEAVSGQSRKGTFPAGTVLRFL